MSGGSLQEIITRGRFVFSNAPKRFDVFTLVDGSRTAKEIALKVGRSPSAVLNDIRMLTDFGLVAPKRDNSGNPVKKGNAAVLEKSPLARHVSNSYFRPIADTRPLVKAKVGGRQATKTSMTLRTPSEQELLDICNNGEDQLYEFKGPGTKGRKLAKEIAGFSHTRRGGILLYGVDDDGSIIGSNLTAQQFDQKIQNSAQNSITPPPSVLVAKRSLMGAEVQLAIIPPWDRKTLFQFGDGRYYIRKGTNVFALKPGEIRKLTKGEYVV